MKKYLYPLIWSIVGITAIWYDGFNRFQSEKNEYIDSVTKHHVTLYRSVSEALRPLADSIYELEVNRPEVLAIMNAALNANEKQRSRLRRRLYRTLLKVYRCLRIYDIRQFHFHLPGGVSFLRFHRPRKFGDSLEKIRPSIEIVNKTRKPVHCFEEGRIFNGFRNLYPLVYKGKFVGSVEISFDAGAIIKRMRLLQPHETLFLIDRSLIEHKVCEEERKNYLNTPLSDRFLIDGIVMRKFPDRIIAKESLETLMRKLKAKVEKPMEKGRTFTVPSSLGNDHYLATFISIPNCKNRPVAYLVIFEKTPFVDHLIAQRRDRFVMGTVLILLIAFLLYFDLDQEEKYRKKLEKEAIVDRLSGCYNRHAFNRFAPMMIADARRYERALCILFFDIDHFKKINDTYGHDIGDSVLKEVARYVRSNIRKNDLCIRWGGEEFMILTSGIHCRDAWTFAEKLREGIARLSIERIDRVTASFGIACLKPDESIEETIVRADKALYKAKESGRDKVVADCANDSHSDKKRQKTAL